MANLYPIKKIKIGSRFRRDLGELVTLTKSIRDIGLLHPIVIDSDGKLIAGQRRVAAYRELGHTEIPATVVDLDALSGEHDENVCRKDFTPSEGVAIGKAVEEHEKAAAKQRQKEGVKTGGKIAGRGRQKDGVNFTPSNGRAKSRDRIAAAGGMSAPTYKKASAIVDAAAAEPEKYGDLQEKMDKDGKVEGAFNELEKRRSKEHHDALLTDMGLTREDIEIKELPCDYVVKVLLKIKSWLLGIDNRWPMPARVQKMSKGGRLQVIDCLKSTIRQLSQLLKEVREK